jgi:DNA-binding transcriptional LysR family regulator
MELRHLRYFLAVAEELHFGRAAEKLHISQPPLSQQIQQLESMLGFQLFHRTKRNVQLTEAGQVFLEETQQIFKQLEEAIEKGRQTNRGETGRLAVGFVSSAVYKILPPILRRFRTSVAGVSLELHELTSDRQIQWLQEGKLDIGFVRPPIARADFEIAAMFQEPLIVALPESHSLCDSFECLETRNRAKISLSLLANESFIIFPRPVAPELYDRIIALCQQANFSPKVVQEAIQMQTIVSLVAADMGIAIVPASIQNLQRTGVIYKSISETTPTSAIAAIWRKNKRSATIDRFVEVVREIALEVN